MTNGSDYEWNSQQEMILKKWAEISASYQWMHDRSYRIYKEKNIKFALPVIVISTITGTANFAQQSFPEKWKSYFIMAIGTLNLTAGLITTIAQFLRINELQEGYRASTVGFAKLSRNIEVMLDLPLKYRGVHGEAYLESSKQEYDRLIEQSPVVPKIVLKAFMKKFKKRKFAKPNLIDINEIDVYHEDIDHGTEEHNRVMRNLHEISQQMTSIREINTNSVPEAEIELTPTINSTTSSSEEDTGGNDSDDIV